MIIVLLLEVGIIIIYIVISRSSLRLQFANLMQDNYLEEAFKMRNLFGLEEFNEDHGVRPPTIWGVREHIFTGRCIWLEKTLVHTHAVL